MLCFSNGGGRTFNRVFHRPLMSSHIKTSSFTKVRWICTHCSLCLQSLHNFDVDFHPTLVFPYATMMFKYLWCRIQTFLLAGRGSMVRRAFTMVGGVSLEAVAWSCSFLRVGPKNSRGGGSGWQTMTEKPFFNSKSVVTEITVNILSCSEVGGYLF